MSWDVEKAFWYHWEPGKHCNWDVHAEGSAFTGEQVKAEWLRWEKRNHDAIRLLLLGLANNSTIVNVDWAMTYVKVENLAAMIDRSPRQTQRILRMLQDASELESTPCDQAACRGYHGDTYHWWLPRPIDADPWGDMDVWERRRQRRLVREGKQPKQRTPRKRKEKK